jgi:hypothetical protein
VVLYVCVDEALQQWSFDFCLKLPPTARQGLNNQNIDAISFQKIALSLDQIKNKNLSIDKK